MHLSRPAVRAGLCALLGLLAAQAQTARETVIHHFAPARPSNATPGLTRDAQGNLYGTDFGGDGQYGQVFKIDPSGRYTRLYMFEGGPSGANPIGTVSLDAAGNIYGVTSDGGAAAAGVLWKLAPNGQETVLASFGGTGSPAVGPIVDSAGNVFGIEYGFPHVPAFPTLYRVDPAGTYTPLFYFWNLGGYGGLSPISMHDAGDIYGTSIFQGNEFLYKVDSSGNFTQLHRFTGGVDGQSPIGGVVFDSSGNLYGLTQQGGAANAGVIYKFDTGGNYSVVYNIPASTGNSETILAASLALDSSGNFYLARTGSGANNAGEILKVDSLGNLTMFFSFDGRTGGGGPVSLMSDPDGNLYGIASAGGPLNGGVTFAVNPAGQEVVLHDFASAVRGATPLAGLIKDAKGKFYGTTVYSGAKSGTNGTGIVYQVNQSGNFKVLYDFGSNPNDPIEPRANLFRDALGNLYGTSVLGGTSGDGTLFKVDTSGHETILYNFNSTGGANPESSVIEDSAGDLYGATCSGGANGQGVIFKLDPTGAQTVLYNFTGQSDGACPSSGLILDSKGNLYGTTYSGGGTADAGLVFRISPDGTEHVLHRFRGRSDGGSPIYNLIRDSAGNLYGTTYRGGVTGDCEGAYGGCGVVYKISPRGHQTVLHAFTGGADGAIPSSGLTRDPDGNLYGTTFTGAVNGRCTMPPQVIHRNIAGCGVVYKIDKSGNFSVLYSFTNQTDGGVPVGGVVRTNHGELFGVTNQGGLWQSGVVYKVALK